MYFCVALPESFHLILLLWWSDNVDSISCRSDLVGSRLNRPNLITFILVRKKATFKKLIFPPFESFHLLGLNIDWFVILTDVFKHFKVPHAPEECIRSFQSDQIFHGVLYTYKNTVQGWRQILFIKCCLSTRYP